MYSQFDKEVGPGTRHCEFVYRPAEYLRFGDRAIRNIPLINTSLKELGEMSWYLGVTARFIAGCNYTRVKYHFSDPDRTTGYPYLVFKLWVKGNFVAEEKLNPFSLIKLLVERDLTPNFSKPPIFQLRLPDIKTITETIETVREVPAKVSLDNEYEILVELNAQRKEKLKKLKKVGNVENTSGELRALPFSA